MKDIIIIEKIIWSLKLKLNFIMCSIEEDFFSHAKRILGFFYYIHFLLIFFLNLFNWQYFFWNVCAEWWLLKGVQQFVDSRAQHFVVCWFSTIFFLIYYFLEFDTYNSWLNERYRDNPSTEPNLDLDLWLEIGCMVDPIEIGCIDSLTLQSRTCRWPVVFQPFDDRNQFQTLKL
jgi:hypothetical protein